MDQRLYVCTYTRNAATNAQVWYALVSKYALKTSTYGNMLTISYFALDSNASGHHHMYSPVSFVPYVTLIWFPDNLYHTMYQ